MPEVVLRIPCVFLTTQNRLELRNSGWFPYALLDEGLRTRLAWLYLPGPHAPDRARGIQALKDELQLNLDNRRDAATGRIVLQLDSEQMVLLGEVSGRDWEFSFMTTHVTGNSEVDLDAILSTPLRGLPVTSQTYRSGLVHPAAYWPARRTVVQSSYRRRSTSTIRACGTNSERALRHTPIPGSSIISPWRW